MYINSAQGIAKNYIHFNCFYLCCKLCLWAQGLMQARKQLQRILGHHPKTLVLLGTEPYTILLMATRYHVSSTVTSSLRHKPSNFRSSLAKYFAQKDVLMISLSSGESDLLGGLPGRGKSPLLCEESPKSAAVSSCTSLPRNHSPTTILLPVHEN